MNNKRRPHVTFDDVVLKFRARVEENAGDVPEATPGSADGWSNQGYPGPLPREENPYAINPITGRPTRTGRVTLREEPQDGESSVVLIGTDRLRCPPRQSRRHHWRDWDCEPLPPPARGGWGSRHWSSRELRRPKPDIRQLNWLRGRDPDESDANRWGVRRWAAWASDGCVLGGPERDSAFPLLDPSKEWEEFVVHNCEHHLSAPLSGSSILYWQWLSHDEAPTNVLALHCGESAVRRTSFGLISMGMRLIKAMGMDSLISHSSFYGLPAPSTHAYRRIPSRPHTDIDIPARLHASIAYNAARKGWPAQDKGDAILDHNKQPTKRGFTPDRNIIVCSASYDENLDHYPLLTGSSNGKSSQIQVHSVGIAEMWQVRERCATLALAINIIVNDLSHGRWESQDVQEQLSCICTSAGVEANVFHKFLRRVHSSQRGRVRLER